MVSIHLRQLLSLVIIAALLFGCGMIKHEPTITSMIPSTVRVVPVQADAYKRVACPFETSEDMPAEFVREIQCATLSVPEDRSQLDSPKIQLAVAVVKTSSTSPKPDPVLVLVGNPGFGLNIAYGLSYMFQSISAERDMIVIDQRGTGYSEPSFACPQLTSLYQDANVNPSLQEANDQLYEASQSCYETIKTSNKNLSFYTTAAVAADLEDLRQVLGISQWNIYALFDGSRLALTMMRDYPQGIRSVILDSAVPLQANPAAEWGTNALMAFDNLFQRCAEDAQCFKAYPNLKENFTALLDQLDAQPIQIDSTDPNSGNRNKITLTSERLITFFLGNINAGEEREALQEIPRMINQLQGGKTEAIARLMGRFNNFLPLLAMGLWIACNEEFSFFTLAQATSANNDIDSHLGDYFDIRAEGYFHACEPWKAPGVPEIENQLVISYIPTLLFSGEFDWSQPTAWAEKAAQSLRNSTVVEIPGAGQAPYLTATSVCPHQIGDAFLETPATKPDISCVSNPHEIKWNTTP